MVKRIDLKNNVASALKRGRIVALLGPRQCGKTTLAREFALINSPNYFDLEDPASIVRLQEPMTALQELKGTIVIDEIQRRPGLFPVLRVLADRNPLPSKFLILGSASPDLLRQSSESLAGRIQTIVMTGFSLAEIGTDKISRHWLRGGFPLSFLSSSEEDSYAWRKNFIQTFLERDIPQFGIHIPSVALLRFWTILAHYHGQTWNAADAARTLGVSEHSVRRYLDILSSAFMIRQLQPWHANISKRQVKAPKIYFHDTGLLHTLLGMREEKDLLSHPKCGASWEGYVIEEIIKASDPDESYFWATHNGAEIDLIVIKEGKMFGIECKRTDAPGITPSMKTAIEDLKLEKIAVVYPGYKRYRISENIHAVPVSMILEGTKSLFPKDGL